MDMQLGTFTIYGVLRLPKLLAFDWSIFSYIKPLVTELDVLCGDMTGPLENIWKLEIPGPTVEIRNFTRIRQKILR